MVHVELAILSEVLTCGPGCLLSTLPAFAGHGRMRQLRLRSHFFYKADNLKLQMNYIHGRTVVFLKKTPVVCNQIISNQSLKHFILNVCWAVTALPHDQISRNACRLSGLRSVEPLCEVSGCGCEHQHAPTISMSQ